MRQHIQSNEQREGRILRQGNQNVSIEIYRYVVERSFDAYSWQTVERKAKFIAQVTRGRLDVRSIEDIGDQALSYTEVKALASGDPLILEHARASNEVTRLKRLERAWVKNREQLRYTLASAVEREEARDQDVEAIEQAIARRVDTRGEKFAMTVGAVHYTERTAAAADLVRWAQTAPLGRMAPIGQLGGFQVNGVVKVDYVNGGREAHLALEGVPAEAAHATMKHLAESPLTLLRQLEHRIGDLEQRRARTIVSRQEAAQDIARAREGLERPFKHAAELQARCAELATITEQMRAAAQSPPASPDTSQPAAHGPDDISAADVGERDDTSRLEPRRPRDRSRGPGREAVGYRPRPRPPVTTPPEIHSHTPPGGLEL